MTSTLLDNFPLILDKTFESLPVLVKRDDWPLYNHKLRLALSTWVSPYSRWGARGEFPLPLRLTPHPSPKVLLLLMHQRHLLLSFPWPTISS